VSVDRIVRLYELWTVGVSVKTDCGGLSTTGCNYGASVGGEYRRW